VRVVISAYTSDPQGGSESLNGWSTAEGIARLGHDVVLLTRPEKARGIDARLTELGSDVGLRVVFVSDHVPQSVSRGQIGVYVRYAAWQSRALKEARRRGLDSFDLVHHVSWGSVTHPVGLARLGPPLVLGPVGGGEFLLPAHEVWMDSSPQRERYRRAYLQHLASRSPLARRMARSSAVALATNPESAQLLKAMGAEDVREMLMDAVPDEALSPRHERGSNMQLLWVARFLPRKGARLALRTFAEVLRQEPSARLRMVGDGPTLANAKQYARTTGIDEAVEFTGRLPWAEVQEHYRQAHVFLFTSVREAFGAQMLEASAKGLPTVAVRQSGIGASLPIVAGNLVEPLPGHDLPERLADAVVRMLDQSPAEWMAQSSTSYQFATLNSWTAHCRRLSDLYQEIV
jgi:glycosyltransferase involved in cell wall biosynthesis